MQAVAEQFDYIPVALIDESPTNPRQHFHNMEDLIADVRQRRRIIQPLLLRPRGERYEVIAGARRLRAARAVDLEKVPALISDMPDLEVLELQLIENLQREDVHPIEEARAYRLLMEKGRYTVADVAVKTGKEESYIYRRLKLNDLIPDAQKACYDDALNPAMAEKLARLQRADQHRALQLIINPNGWIKTARDLQQWMEREVFLDLHSAPWDTNDATLLPQAGACNSCPKRTGFTPMLFPELKKHDTCTDPVCFRQKQVAAVNRKRDSLREKHPELMELTSDYQSKDRPYLYSFQQYTAKEAKSMPEAVPALVVDGSNAGDVVYIVPGERRGHQLSAAQKEAERKRRDEERLKQKVQFAQVEKLLGFTAVNPTEMLRFLAARFWEKAGSDLSRVILRRRELEAVKKKHTYGVSIDRKAPIAQQLASMDADALQGLLLEIALGAYNSYSEDAIAKAAEICEVDLATTEKEVRAKEKDAKAKAKKAKSAKPKRGVCQKCGCTMTTPCMTDAGPCAWTDKTETLCTACAQKPKKSSRRKAAGGAK